MHCRDYCRVAGVDRTLEDIGVFDWGSVALEPAAVEEKDNLKPQQAVEMVFLVVCMAIALEALRQVIEHHETSGRLCQMLLAELGMGRLVGTAAAADSCQVGIGDDVVVVHRDHEARDGLERHARHVEDVRLDSHIALGSQEVASEGIVRVVEAKAWAALYRHYPTCLKQIGGPWCLRPDEVLWR